MTALARYFFDTVYVPRSSWSVVRWWEARRLSYNLAVGSAGVLTLGTATVLHGPPPLPALGISVLVYGLVANLCYSLGPIADLAARRWGGAAFAPVGPALLRHGFVFSVGLTLLPIPFLVLARVLDLLGRLLA